MKNILARGGIEFLAVIMGISGSLWLDDNSNYKSHRKQEYEAYNRLSNALSEDIKLMDEALIENDRVIFIIENMMNNKVNIERLQKDMEKVLEDIEELKDKIRDTNGANEHKGNNT